MPPGGSVEALWRRAAENTLAWLDRRGVAVRDAVLLVPFAALLAPARSAFAACAQQRGGWMPRIETALTLAAALGPPPALAAGACCGEARQDGLHAAEQLRSLAAVADIEQQDPARFAVLALRLAETAAALRAAALAMPPEDRVAHWQAVHAALRPNPGPAALEWALLTAAAAWAEASSVPSFPSASSAALAQPAFLSAATDHLYAARPGAWIALQIAGPEPLAEGVLRAARVPALRLVADAPGADPFAAASPPARLKRLACDDTEHEAQAAAAEVIGAINAGRLPVALVVLDRLLARRVRALLERRGVHVVDETGWRLATTMAGTRVVGLLRAARPGADADARLAWLKTWPRAEGEGLRSLEARWRQRRHVPNPAAADRLEQAAGRHLAELREAGAAPLAQWLHRLRDALARGGELAALLADHAGRQVIEALWLGEEGPPAAAAEAAARWQPTLGGFLAWVESALQSTEFLPELPESADVSEGAEGAEGAEAPRVVLTPLARAVGRPFAHIVLPAADEAHLGAPQRPAAWVPPAWAEALGLPTLAAVRTRQRQALAQLMRVPAVTVLRRRSEDAAPLAPSPDMEWLWLRLTANAKTPQPPAAAAPAQASRSDGPSPPPPEQAWQPQRGRAALRPAARPAPRVDDQALPAMLSATRITALRTCPYRFFAMDVLGLEEAEELAEPLSKREYGNWLHELLLAFHARRASAASDAAAAGETPSAEHTTAEPGALGERDERWLVEAATQAAAKLGLDAAQLLPYQASFEVFAPAYLRWLAEREAQGWRWAAGESPIELTLPELAPTRLRGVIDRVDHLGGAPAAGSPGEVSTAGVAVLDYKAGDIKRQRQSVGDPLEDTQLCVYAVLMQAAGRVPAPLQAAYLALDSPEAPELVSHPGIERTAAQWLAHFGSEWQRVRAGAALPALGEPPDCDHCAARGLCRRDQWLGSRADGPGDAPADEGSAP